MRILIITGGRIDEDFALSFLKKEKFNHIIVVDGALAFWDKVEKNSEIQCHFDHLVGDFDTISPEILENYLGRKDEDIEVHRFNPEKDYTDTDIALKLAIDLAEDEAGTGVKDGHALQQEGMMQKDREASADVPTAKPEIWLLGATGTRADHMLANMQLLAQTKAAGVEGILVDKNNKIRLLEGSYTLKKAEQFGDFVSLIPVTQVLKGVTLRGFKYPLEGHTTYWGESLCVSNELEAEEGFISIEEGLAFLIESRD